MEYVIETFIEKIDFRTYESLYNQIFSNASFWNNIHITYCGNRDMGDISIRATDLFYRDKALVMLAGAIAESRINEILHFQEKN